MLVIWMILEIYSFLLVFSDEKKDKINLENLKNRDIVKLTAEGLEVNGYRTCFFIYELWGYFFIC